MKVSRTETWHAFNRACFSAELARLRSLLDTSTTPPPAPPTDPRMSSSIDHLCEAFGLDAFERDAVLLCAGVEADAELADRCAASQGNPQWTRPTVGFALAALPGANWQALSPSGTLRRMELIELDRAVEFVRAPLGINETVLHFLLDGVYLDPDLDGIAEELDTPPSPVDEHRVAVEKALAFWESASGPLPVLHLATTDPGDGVAAAALLCQSADLRAWRVDATALPSAAGGNAPGARLKLARRWQRLARLFEAVAVVVVPDDATAEMTEAAWRFAESAGGPVVLVGERRVGTRPGVVTVELPRASTASRRILWRSALTDRLGASPEPNAVERLAATFDLDSTAITTAAGAGIAAPEDWLPSVWDACRQRARARLDQLARRITVRTGWDQLIVPPALAASLRDLVAQLRHRTLVHETWGMGPEGSRGLGVAALFSGPSGTGKTMAAEVVANALDLDLYCIDLSAMVSKYIGETEKNLARIFDAAETGGAVLLFDEADALFGKRSQVQDSHDRYANIETGYLLQRMESYRGLALLTTNLRDSLDLAFLRRLRFVLDFPFPDASLRARMWSVALPDTLPQEGVSAEALARLSLAGGQIRSVAINAAFLAAADGGVLRPRHLLIAARREYAKHGRALTEAETRMFGATMPVDDDRRGRVVAL